MLTIDCLLINIMCLLFPISIYLVYVFCVRTISSTDKDHLFDLMLFSMMYMLLRYGRRLDGLYPFMLYNLPLFICYLKQKKVHAIIVSCVLSLYSYINFDFSLLLLFFEYGLYYVIYYVFSKKYQDVKKFIYPYILVRIFFVSLETVIYIMPNEALGNVIMYIFMSSSILVSFNYIILFLFQKAEEIVNYRNTLKELSKEKDLRSALFKITHEVKNPLAVCRGYLDMLEDASFDRYQKYVPIIDSEINRTLLLMDDFLDYTKVKVNREEVDLIMLIEEVSLELDPLFIKNKIKTNFSIPDMEIYSLIDYNRMKQVFVNVFKNSIEAMNGKLFIDLSITFDGDFVVIKISDNGVGIPSDVLNRIGETFFTTKERGTGLGVSLSMEIVELHGGVMYYESVYGEGTDVYIKLPYIKEDDTDYVSANEKVACCD